MTLRAPKENTPQKIRGMIAWHDYFVFRINALG